MGVANDHSIAWGIAQMLASQGAEIAFTYQGDAQKKRLGPLAASVQHVREIPMPLRDLIAQVYRQDSRVESRVL